MDFMPIYYIDHECNAHTEQSPCGVELADFAEASATPSLRRGFFTISSRASVGNARLRCGTVLRTRPSGSNFLYASIPHRRQVTIFDGGLLESVVHVNSREPSKWNGWDQLMSRKSGKVYHSAMWVPRDARSGPFITIPLPGGGVLRVVDKGLHLAALDSAGKKLVELRRKSGNTALVV